MKRILSIENINQTVLDFVTAVWDRNINLKPDIKELIENYALVIFRNVRNAYSVLEYKDSIYNMINFINHNSFFSCPNNQELMPIIKFNELCSIYKKIECKERIVNLINNAKLLFINNKDYKFRALPNGEEFSYCPAKTYGMREYIRRFCR